MKVSSPLACLAHQGEGVDKSFVPLIALRIGGKGVGESFIPLLAWRIKGRKRDLYKTTGSRLIDA